MATPNPMTQNKGRHDYGPDRVSAKEYHIAGILVTVYGLEELPNVKDVACLWLLHPRLQKHAIMAPVAAAAILDWNKKLQESQSARSNPKGLIAVSFDQRNHGTRQVNKLANESWKAGNPAHAADMFSIFRRLIVIIDRVTMSADRQYRRNGERYINPHRLPVLIYFPKK